MLSGCKSFDHVIYNTISNGETNAPYLLQTSLSPSYAKEEIHLGKNSASPMSSGERKKGYDKNDPSKYNKNLGMGKRSSWKMAL